MVATSIEFMRVCILLSVRGRRDVRSCCHQLSEIYLLVIVIVSLCINMTSLSTRDFPVKFQFQHKRRGITGESRLNAGQVVIFFIEFAIVVTSVALELDRPVHYCLMPWTSLVTWTTTWTGLSCAYAEWRRCERKTAYLFQETLILISI